MGNEYDQDQIMAYARLLHSLNGIQYLAIKCYRVSGSYYGGDPEKQTEYASKLIEILKDANQKIAAILPDYTIPEAKQSVQASGCPNGFYNCNNECIHVSLPCP